MAKSLTLKEHALMIQARDNETMPIEIDDIIYMIPRKVNELIYTYLRRTGDYKGRKKGYEEFFRFTGVGKPITFRETE